MFLDRILNFIAMRDTKFKKSETKGGESGVKNGREGGEGDREGKIWVNSNVLLR